MEEIKSVFMLELSVYVDGEVITSDVFGLYSTIYNCLKRLLQFEKDLTEQQRVEFLMDKVIKIEYPAGDYVYRAIFVGIDEF